MKRQILSILILILVLVFAVYSHLSRFSTAGPALKLGIPGNSQFFSNSALSPSPSPLLDPLSAKLAIQSDSDDPAAILKDANNTDLTNLDQESMNIVDLFTSPSP